MSCTQSFSVERTNVEYCRLAGLPDLDQSNPFVRSTLKDWVHDIVATYGLDGIRIDTIPEVPKDFWTEYSHSAGVYSIGEVFHGKPSYVASYQGAVSALFNYPMYYQLNRAFKERKSMYKIREGIEQNSVFPDVSILGNFVDNHDNPRFLSGNVDTTLLKNGLAYIIFAEVTSFFECAYKSYSNRFCIAGYSFYLLWY